MGKAAAAGEPPRCQPSSATALKTSEVHFRELVEQASDGIFIADPNGKYLDVNSAGAEMLGYTRDEVLRLSIADVVVPEDIARIKEEIERFSGGRTIRSDWTFRRQDGSTFPGEVAARQLADGGLQAILRDDLHAYVGTITQNPICSSLP